MKISRLTVAGFGPYKTEQHVDFERFDDDGIFLISGKTGAGKSSILDAICYALYGSVPRYDGTQAQLRSDHAEPTDPTFVELEFSVDDIRYRVRRVPEFDRPKARGAGTTKQAHEATLWTHRADGWEGIATKPVDVGRELARILTLNKDQFLQVILLAQNRFQEFLLARNDDRQAVLRTLFGTKRFQDIENELDERRKVLALSLLGSEQALARHGQRIADVLGSDDVPATLTLDWLDSAATSLGDLLAAATATALTADSAFVESDRIHAESVGLRARQERRDAASAALKTLVSLAHAVDLDRVAVAAAHRAATVWPLAIARENASSALEEAVSHTAAARAVFELYNEPDADPAAVSDSVTGQLATLGDVLAEEARLPALEATVGSLNRSLTDADLRLAELTALGTSLPLEISAVETRLASATLRDSHAADAAAALERATAAHSAAALAITTEALLLEASLAEKAASSAHLAAVAHVDDLLGRRVSGFAAELATDLVDGEPCSVCGSVSHPAPAPRVGDAVTEADVALARTRSAESGTASVASSAVTRRLATELATVIAKADGLSVEAADTAVAEARASLADSRAAAAEKAAFTLTRDALHRQLAGNADAIDEVRASREQTLRSITEARAVVKSIVERVSRATAGYDSVADRVERLSSEAESARSLLDAVGVEATRASVATAAIASLTEQVTSEGFEDAEAAIAARLDAGALAMLEARIRSHDDRVAASVATIADAADIPHEHVDVELARENRRIASQIRDAALTDRSSIETRKVELDSAAKEAAGELTVSGRRQAEYDQVRQLAAVIAGNEPNEKRMRLESFVLAAQLEEIVTAANVRLYRMTGGRFALEHDDALQFRGARSGLSLAIRDEHTGRSRATHSLSGGETFLASLALALGLAEVVTNQAGGIRLDTLFVDEGFGSLDSDTLEIAMTTLDGLRAGGRTIGLISHVEAMKEQIPSKLLIRVTDKGYSEIG